MLMILQLNFTTYECVQESMISSYNFWYKHKSKLYIIFHHTSPHIIACFCKGRWIAIRV